MMILHLLTKTTGPMETLAATLVRLQKQGFRSAISLDSLFQDLFCDCHILKTIDLAKTSWLFLTKVGQYT